jgi:hypothetical protein
MKRLRIPFLALCVFMLKACTEAPTPNPCLNQPPSIPRIDDYHPDNFFFKALPTSVTIKPNSQIMVDRLVLETAGIFRVSANEFSEKVYYVTESTPRYDVYRNSDFCNASFQNEVIQNVPIPQGAMPAFGSDQQITLVDVANQLTYNFQAFNSISNPCNTWGCYQFGGAGVAPIKNSGVVAYQGRGFAGAGFLGIAGAIWPDELINGYINHALRASYKITKNEFVDPAIKSDGTYADEDAIPMGTLLQLDPSIDVTDPAYGMNRSEQIIAKAMQDFGLYMGDTNGAGLSVKAISVKSYTCNPYDDYIEGANVGGECTTYKSGNIDLKNIPLQYLRIIEFPHTFYVTEDTRVVRMTDCLPMCN